MKKTFIIFLAVFLSGNIFSQTNKKDIDVIRTQFKFINSQKNLKKIYLENEEFTDDIPSEGCGLEGYYLNGELLKAVEQDAVSTGLYTSEYYLKDGKLIFVYRYEKEFLRNPETGEFTDSKKTYEERVYYKNGKIIRHLEKGKSLLKNTPDYQKLFSDYRKYLDTKVKYKKQYDLLQGLWINTDNNDDSFEISGTKTLLFDAPELSNPFRFWIEEGGRYIFFHYTNTNEDVKFEILELTDKSFQIQNRLTGEVLTYEKN